MTVPAAPQVDFEAAQRNLEKAEQLLCNIAGGLEGPGRGEIEAVADEIGRRAALMRKAARLAGVGA